MAGIRGTGRQAYHCDCSCVSPVGTTGRIAGRLALWQKQHDGKRRRGLSRVSAYRRWPQCLPAATDDHQRTRG